MINNHKDYALILYKLAEQNRQYSADNLIKSYAPNAKDLQTKKLNFTQVLQDVSESKTDLEHTDVNASITSNSQSVPVNTSKQQSAMALSEAALLNRTLYRLLNHSLTEERSIVDGFRPQ